MKLYALKLPSIVGLFNMVVISPQGATENLKWSLCESRFARNRKHQISRTPCEKKNVKNLINTIFYTDYEETNKQAEWHKDHFKLKTFSPIADAERNLT